MYTKEIGRNRRQRSIIDPLQPRTTDSVVSSMGNTLTCRCLLTVINETMAITEVIIPDASAKKIKYDIMRQVLRTALVCNIFAMRERTVR